MPTEGHLLGLKFSSMHVCNFYFHFCTLTVCKMLISFSLKKIANIQILYRPFIVPDEEVTNLYWMQPDPPSPVPIQSTVERL